MEFEVGEKVFLKVVTVKGVLKFRKKKSKVEKSIYRSCRNLRKSWKCIV